MSKKGIIDVLVQKATHLFKQVHVLIGQLGYVNLEGHYYSISFWPIQPHCLIQWSAHLSPCLLKRGSVTWGTEHCWILMLTSTIVWDRITWMGLERNKHHKDYSSPIPLTWNMKIIHFELWIGTSHSEDINFFLWDGHTCDVSHVLIFVQKI